MSSVSDAIASYRKMAATQRWSRQKRASLERAERALGKWPLRRLTEPNLVDWALERSPYAPSTTMHALATLSGALRYVARRRLFAVPNPTAAADAIQTLRDLQYYTPRPRDPGRISDATLRRVGRAWNSHIPWVYIPLLVHTAMRSGELCRITWEDVDLDARIFLIRDRKGHPKWGNHQRVPLLRSAWEILRDLPGRQGRVCPHSRDTLSAAFSAACARAGVAYHLHDLRHEGISRLFDHGLRTHQVQLISGHNDLKTLRLYTHPTPESVVAWDRSQEGRIFLQENPTPEKAPSNDRIN